MTYMGAECLGLQTLTKQISRTTSRIPSGIILPPTITPRRVAHWLCVWKGTWACTLYAHWSMSNNPLRVSEPRTPVTGNV